MAERIRRLAALAIFLAPLIPTAGAQETVTVGAESVVEYILSCRKPNGAFGPIDQHYTDAAWNYPAVAALTLLGHEIEDPEAILKNGLGYPEGHVGYGHWQFFHYHKLRELLGRPVKLGKEMKVGLELWKTEDEIPYYGSPFGTDGDTFFKAGSGPDPDPRDLDAEALGYYNLSSLFYLTEALKASGRLFYPGSSRGGFGNLGPLEKPLKNQGAHVVTIFQELSVPRSFLKEPGRPTADQHVRFLQACQADSGGFRWNPAGSISGNFTDIYYTWAAVKALDLLGEKPANEAACLAWINSLQNADGGFGDQPGWRSRLYSTWYAIDALATLTGGDPAEAIASKKRYVPVVKPIPEGRYQIYQGLFKTPIIEPDDLKGLSDRGFNLLALKSDDFSLAESLRAAVLKSDLPMDVVLCPEAYPHRARHRGGALLHHLYNPILDPGWTPDQRSRWLAADSAGAEGLDWKDYQEQVIAPIRHLGSLVYPEQDFEMEYAYSVYDAGLNEVGGYSAILAGFNWAPRDFVRVFPWRERYVDKLIPIADCDAHGDLEKWSPQLDHARHLYIAGGPGYQDFQEAVLYRRVVCVIRNAGKDEPPATFYGRPAAVAYVKERVEEWKWWE